MAKKLVHKKHVAIHAARPVTHVTKKSVSASTDVTKQPFALPIIVVFVLFAGWFFYSQYLTYRSFDGRPTYFEIPKQENNKPPTVVTYALPSATQGKAYQMFVVGSDPDGGERMTMIIAGLPLGMKQGNCSEYEVDRPDAKREIKCGIDGTPNQAGDFSLLVSVTDSANHQTRNEMPLHVISAQ